MGSKPFERVPEIGSSQGSGERVEGGITISRRPNKRPSIENAPGPSRAIEIHVTINPKPMNLVSCEVQEAGGNQEKAIPKKHRDSNSPASGVRKPINKAAPPMIRAKPRSQRPEKRLGPPERKRIPSALAATATTVRSSKRPTPGLPAGKVENSLCSASLLSRHQKQSSTEDTRTRRFIGTLHQGIFSYHFWGTRLRGFRGS